MATFMALVALGLAVAAMLVASGARQAASHQGRLLRERDARLNRFESRLQALERRRDETRSGAAPAAEPTPPAPAEVATPAEATAEAAEADTYELATAPRTPRSDALRAALHRVAGDSAEGGVASDAEAPQSPPKPAASEAQEPAENEAISATAPPAGLVNVRTNVHQAERPAAAAASWEEKLGARLFVWIGGVALLLAGAFLVKYSFDSGLLSPGVRLVMAAGFGVTLLVAGEWMRQRSARVAEALTAAGVADLFAVVLAATRLYEFLSPTVGFALMAGLTAAAVVLSLRHGQFVALLGLLGGFVTPALISDGPGAPGPLFTYLLLLETGLVIVTGRRGWIGLTTLTLVGSLVWAAVYGIFLGGPAAQAWAAPFLVASAAAYVAGAARLTSRDGPRTQPFVLAIVAVVASAALLGLLAAYGSFSLIEMGLLALLGAGAIVLARLDARYLAMPAVCAGVTLVMLLAWWLRGFVNLGTIGDETLGRLALGFGGLYALGGYACLWGSTRRFAWSVLSVLAGHAFAIAAWAMVGDGLPAWLPWWAVALVLAAVYAAMAAPTLRLADDSRRTAGALALGSVGFLTYAAPLAFDNPWVAVAWSLLAAAVAWAALPLRLPALRWAVAWLAALAVAMLIFPGPLTVDLGGNLLLTPLIPQYGVPALAFAAAALALRRQGNPSFARALLSLAVAGGMALVTLVIRHAFHREDLLELHITAYEWATYAGAWGGIGLGLLSTTRRAEAVAIGFTGVGVLLAIIGPVALSNPLWTDVALGVWPVVNGLWYLYGLPAAIATGAAAVLHRRGDDDTARWFAGGAVVLVLALLTMLVRQAFHPAEIDADEVRLFEWGTYAAVHGLFGVAILATIGGRMRFLQHVGTGFATLGVAVAVIGVGLAANPLWTEESVGGWPIVNGLWYLVGLPGAIAAAASALLWRRGEVLASRAFGVAAVVALFALVSLLVRQAFAGGVLDLDLVPVVNAERYAYSLSWVVLGVALLAAGVWRGSAVLRYASLAVMLLAVGKVFILDAAQLRDLWRVLSFLGLGLSLLVLGYVYQRFVFGGKPRSVAGAGSEI